MLAVDPVRTATIDVLVAQAQADLRSGWVSLLSDPVERAAEGMRVALPAVARAYGRVAAEEAADWYVDARPSGLDPFAVQPVAPKSLAEAAGRTTWAVTPLFSGDATAAWGRLAPMVDGLVRGHVRETVIENAARDPERPRWMRRANIIACAFCAYMCTMVEASSDEARGFHDGCRCELVCVWDGEDAPDQPRGEEWWNAFRAAREQIMDERNAIPGYHRLRRLARSKRYPEYQLTTKNILARARRIAPDLFTDGVPVIT
jgi:hypothetical protein